ncbi:MAG TPA: sulfite exporter TauE/SafE family protein [Streptosporangiaceae bacterium]|nr:sulfite exporter TauE/SafE family protein [Streptosporangiaceae bacterium]
MTAVTGVAVSCGWRVCLGDRVAAGDVPILIGVGVLAGIVSTVASLASIISYPALLAIGLPPLSANVTNTVALMFTGVGAALGSRPELRGQGGLVGRLGLVTVMGGATGAALLLVTPAETFEAAAPWLVGAASLTLLLNRAAERPKHGAHRRALLVALFGVALYVGYFGAAGGILMLAVLTALVDRPSATVNAIKNAVAGMANGVAAIGFAAFGPVRWGAAVPLAVGFLAGGWLGPALVRRLPGRTLRVGVGLCGLAVAVKLGVDTYR